MPPLPADFIHARACKLKCEKILTRPVRRSDLPAHPQDQSVVLQFPKGPLAGLCTVPQRHGQLCEGKSVGFSFGHGKGAACLPRLGGWCLIFRFWLDKVSRGGATQIFRLAHYFC